MEEEDLIRLERRTGVSDLSAIALEAHRYLASPVGHRLAAELAHHVSAYNSTNDLVPYFGDYRLAYSEAQFQLHNAVCLAYYGFYSQAVSTLRPVLELSMLQAVLPEGEFPSDGPFNSVWFLGQHASLGSGQTARSLKEWAIDGLKTPKWQDMLSGILSTDSAKQFDKATEFGSRLQDTFRDIHPFVHETGYLRSAIGLSRGGLLRFSPEALALFGTYFTRVVQLSVITLLLAFLPDASDNPQAAAGFIDISDLGLVLRILPENDQKLLRQMYYERHT